MEFFACSKSPESLKFLLAVLAIYDNLEIPPIVFLGIMGDDVSLWVPMKTMDLEVTRSEFFQLSYFMSKLDLFNLLEGNLDSTLR